MRMYVSCKCLCVSVCIYVTCGSENILKDDFLAASREVEASEEPASTAGLICDNRFDPVELRNR